MTILPHRKSKIDIGMRAAQKDNATWSGYVASRTKPTFGLVQGVWNIPQIDSCKTTASAYSSVWVGLDGYTATDLLQAGTAQSCLVADNGVFTQYYAWTQQPPALAEIQLDGVNPGDNMEFRVWIGDENGAIDPSGQYFNYYILDYNQQQSVLQSEPLLAPFNGNSAEWIVERQEVNCDIKCEIPQLADYGWVDLEEAFAGVLPSYDYVGFGKLENVQVTMTNAFQAGANDNNTLSTVQPLTTINGPSMKFVWQNYN